MNTASGRCVGQIDVRSVAPDTAIAAAWFAAAYRQANGEAVDYVKLVGTQAVNAVGDIYIRPVTPDASRFAAVIDMTDLGEINAVKSIGI